jgi:hypothetical protein
MAGKFDIYEIDLEFLVRLDTDQERGTTTGSDDFIRVMDGLENECKGALQFLQHGLDQVREGDSLALLRVVDVLGKYGGCLCIGIGLKFVSSLLQNETELCRIGNDTIVHDNEFRGRVGFDGMAIPLARGAVCGPPGMSN